LGSIGAIRVYSQVLLVSLLISLPFGNYEGDQNIFSIRRIFGIFVILLRMCAAQAIKANLWLIINQRIYGRIRARVYALIFAVTNFQYTLGIALIGKAVFTYMWLYE
jgi:hypothetical protein